jgi:hypothetical protein
MFLYGTGTASKHPAPEKPEIRISKLEGNPNTEKSCLSLEFPIVPTEKLRIEK